MHFEGEEEAVVDGSVVDGTVTQRHESAQSAGPRYSPAGQPHIYSVDPSYQADPYQQAGQPGGVDLTGLVDAGVSLASDPRSRSVALLVKVPLLAYVAFSDKMPGLVRLAALGLGVMEALEALQQRRPEYEQMPQGY